MSENESQKNQPPKINLNGKSANGNGLKKTDRLDHLPPTEAAGEAPPKIHLGGVHAKSSTSRVDIPQGRPADLKSETSRIELSAAKPVPDEADDLGDFGQTMRVDLSGPSERDKGETSRVDLSAAPEASASGDSDFGQTMRVDLSGSSSPGRSETSRVDLGGEDQPKGSMDFGQTMRVEIPAAPAGDAKAKTSRLDLSQAKPSATGDSNDPFGRTMRVELGVPSAPKSDTSKVTLSSAHTQGIKGETQRADLGATQAAKLGTANLETGIVAGQDDNYKAANDATMRIELDGDGPGAADTQRIIAQDLASERPTVAEPAGRDRTTKVDLSEVFGSAPSDVFKRRAGSGEAGAAAAGAGGVPRTIRIRKPESSQPTRVLKRSPAEAAPEAAAAKSGTSRINLPDDAALSGPPSQRKTIRIKRPGEAAPAASPTTAEASKSGTSRVDLPPSVGESGPPSQRKTIRIKRPEMGTSAGRPLTVARPSSGTGFAASPTPSQIRPVSPAGTAAAPGVGYTVVAGLAMVVAGVLVYVLAAQLNSIGLGQDSVPSWPFYGRIL